MIRQLARVTIFVRDEDEALHFYTDVLGMDKRADQRFGPGMRWLTVAPKDQTEVEIVLQNPVGWQGQEHGNRLLETVGHGTPWVLYTDDCHGDYRTLTARGVKFVAPPAERPYGLETGFVDLYGNPWVLVQPHEG